MNKERKHVPAILEMQKYPAFQNKIHISHVQGIFKNQSFMLLCMKACTLFKEKGIHLKIMLITKSYFTGYCKDVGF